ncbi:MAG TPA: nitroreductase/quinone reductase family protein [Streptosporangiaceae bacterium]|nr:nitroreductase/quinone reductase family protein [Streptosporangiaceae bacterium]
MRTVVRRRPHGRLARTVALLSYRGRVSGRSFTVPVEYAADAEGRYIVVPGDPEHKNWWKNFRVPMTVRFLAAGSDIVGHAALIEEPKERRDALEAYFRRFPMAARAHGLPRHGDGGFDSERLDALADRLVVVRIDRRS